ncbi:MAG: hypothetical protein RL264_2154 [Bacteroidota bacterium]|jgi:acyl carrier protein
MDLAEFLEVLREEFDEIPSELITENIDFRSLEGWSSMHALILIALVDNHFGVLLAGEDLKSVSTVAELYNLVQNKLN